MELLQLANRFRGRGRSSPTLRTWQSTNDGIKNFPLSGTLTPGAAGSTGTPITFIGATAGTDFTVLRTRGMFQCFADLSTAASESIQITVGLGVIPDVAGQTAFPTPIVDADWDGWFLHETIMLSSRVAGTPSDPEHGDLVIDSKAMRKVSGGDSVIASFDSATLTGTPLFVSFAFWARFLFKLS